MSSIVQYILSLQSGQFESGIASASNSVDGLEGKISSLGSAIGLTFGLAGAAMFTRSMIDAGTTVENALTGLTTLLQNSEQAKSVISNTMEDATKTPFAFEGLLSANKALIAADESAVGAREAVLNLANAIAATGGGDDELQRMVVNLQQIRNTGEATAMDIKQFAFAGVNLYKVLDEAGVKHGEHTKITYEQITSALKKAHEEGGIYFNGLENMAGNTSVQISNLDDSLFQLKVQMFNDLKPAITATIETLSGFISGLRDAWDWSVKHRTEIKALVVGWLAARGAALVLIPLLEGYAAATVTATTATAGLAVAETALLGPIGLVILAVGAAAAAYSYMADEAERARIGQKSLTEDYVSNTKENLDEDLKGLVSKGMSESAARKKISEDRRSFYEDDLKRAQDDLRLMEVRAKTLEGLDSAPSEIDLVEARGRVSRAQGSIDALKNFTTTKALSNKSAGTKPSTATTKSQAVGSKSVTFNIHINDLVKTFIVNATTVKEAAGKVRNMISDSLMSSINDFQRTIPE
jgi:tape measure domain-containing protein